MANIHARLMFARRSFIPATLSRASYGLGDALLWKGVLLALTLSLFPKFFPKDSSFIFLRAAYAFNLSKKVAEQNYVTNITQT